VEVGGEEKLNVIHAGPLLKIASKKRKPAKNSGAAAWGNIKMGGPLRQERVEVSKKRRGVKKREKGEKQNKEKGERKWGPTAIVRGSK